MRRHQRSRAAFPWRSSTPVETSLPVAMIVGWRRNAAATSKSVSDSRSIGGSNGRHSNSAMRSWARLSWRCGARCSGICPTTISMPWRRAAWPRPRRCTKNPHKICAGFPSGHRQSDAGRAGAHRRRARLVLQGGHRFHRLGGRLGLPRSRARSHCGRARSFAARWPPIFSGSMRIAELPASGRSR